MGGKCAAHETKAVAGSVVSPATTRATADAFGAAYVLMSSTADIRFTVDGQTDPVITAGSEVGTLLGPGGDIAAIQLTIDEFVNLRMLDVSTDARVQFEFFNEMKRLVY